MWAKGQLLLLAQSMAQSNKQTIQSRPWLALHGLHLPDFSSNRHTGDRSAAPASFCGKSIQPVAHRVKCSAYARHVGSQSNDPTYLSIQTKPQARTDATNVATTTIGTSTIRHTMEAPAAAIGGRGSGRTPAVGGDA